MAANNFSAPVATNDQPLNERRPYELQVNADFDAPAAQLGALNGAVVDTACMPKVEPNERLDVAQMALDSPAADQPAQPVPTPPTQSPPNNEAVVAVAKEDEEVIIIKDEIVVSFFSNS